MLTKKTDFEHAADDGTILMRVSSKWDGRFVDIMRNANLSSSHPD